MTGARKEWIATTTLGEGGGEVARCWGPRARVCVECQSGDEM